MHTYVYCWNTMTYTCLLDNKTMKLLTPDYPCFPVLCAPSCVCASLACAQSDAECVPCPWACMCASWIPNSWQGSIKLQDVIFWDISFGGKYKKYIKIYKNILFVFFPKWSHLHHACFMFLCFSCMCGYFRTCGLKFVAKCVAFGMSCPNIPIHVSTTHRLKADASATMNGCFSPQLPLGCSNTKLTRGRKCRIIRRQ